MDAPADHDAHTYVVARNQERALIKKTNPLQISAFQVTAKQAGNLERALRFCRLCYLEFEKGKSKEEVDDFKQRLLKGGAPPGPARALRKRPAAKAAPAAKRRRQEAVDEDMAIAELFGGPQIKEELDEPQPMARAFFKRKGEADGPEQPLAAVVVQEPCLR
eukprot:Skav232329  [mRNA]  locus=scaffold1704:34590:35075:+ [translate_table: standard]